MSWKIHDTYKKITKCQEQTGYAIERRETMDEFGRCELCGVLTHIDDRLCYDCELELLEAEEFQNMNHEEEDHDPVPLNFND